MKDEQLDEPSFPVTSCAEHQFIGMTLRDYFAAKAIAALILKEKDYQNRGAANIPKMATWSYEYADAMLKARAAAQISKSGGEG